MKAPIYAVAPLLLLVLLGSCAKEKTAPLTLDNTKWRLTAQFQETYLKGTPNKLINRVSAYSDCLGKGAITFAATGQVLWAREADFCYYSFPEFEEGLWGQWQRTSSPDQLRIVTEKTFPTRPSLPGTGDIIGVYDVAEFNREKLVLSYNPRNTQDSLFVFISTFTRVTE